MVDADPGGRGVRHGVQYTVGLDSVRALCVERVIPHVRGLCAPHAAAHEDATTLQALGGKVESCIGDSLARRDQGKLTHAIQHAQARRREVRAAVELRRCADGRSQPVGYRVGESTDARSTLDQIVEEFVTGVAERRDHTQSRDRHAPLHAWVEFTTASVASGALRERRASMKRTTSPIVTRSVGVSSVILRL
jgi:hypothetical protein